MNTVHLKNRIISLLKNLPDLRDDFDKLLSIIWKEEISGKVVSGDLTFLSLVYNHSVSRVLDVLKLFEEAQEEDNTLRGLNYYMKTMNISDACKALEKDKVKKQTSLF